MQHHTVDHKLTFIHLLLINVILFTLTIMTQPPEQNTEEAGAGGVLKYFANFTRKQLCRSLFLTKLQTFRPAMLLKKTPTRVLSCEIWEILKSSYFEEHLWMIASVYRLIHHILIYTIYYYTRLSFIQIAIKTIELMTCEVVPFEEVFHWTKFVAFES